MYRNSDKPNYLFHEGDGDHALREQFRLASVEITSLSEERILNTDPHALAKYFTDKYSVKIPVLDIENLVAAHHERNVTRYDRFDEREYQAKGEAYDIEVPFDGDPMIFKLRPNTYNLNPPIATIEGNNLCFSISGQELDPVSVKEQIDTTIRDVEEYLAWHRKMWQSFDTQLQSIVSRSIEERRAHILKQKDSVSKLAGLGIKLKEKSGDAKTFVPAAIRQTVRPQLPPMRAAQQPEPTFDKAQYATTLGLIRGAGHSIEQSSSRMRELPEEALRDIFLVPLNAHFGSASGETFNYGGKTDIIIKHEGKNLFVAEFKFWGGEKILGETIDQLLSYLTWRDTKTAIVIFNKNVGFSGVLAKIQEATKLHKHYISGPRRLDETSDEYTFMLPQDSDRHVVISILSFDLGAKN
jgi:hypothetical protein